VRHAIAIALVVAGLIAGCGGGDSPSEERSMAIDEAAVAYAKAESSGMNLAPGPCVAESLPGLDGWVVDIAHDPRTQADDDPANQCERFRSGEASHFVELSPDGELIRAE
jgi:hypothetical protein